MWGSPQRPNPAVARIVVPVREGFAYGSGSLVDVNDEFGLVVTNWHVVDEATGAIVVEFPGGFRSTARVLKTDRDWDLAALQIRRPQIEPLRLAAHTPVAGEPLMIAGYGSGTYRAASGKCTQYVAPGVNFPYEMVEVSAGARQGDSGGPILNAEGQLAGVLFGESRGKTSGSYCGRVHRFLASLRESGEIDATPTFSTQQRLEIAQRNAQATAPMLAATDDAWAPTAQQPASRPYSFASTSQPAAADRMAISRGLSAGDTPPPMVPVVGERASVAAARTDDTSTNRFSPTNRFAPPPLAASRVAASEPGWEHFAGSEPLEQIKTALAIVGVCSLLLHGSRFLRHAGHAG